MCEKVWVKVKMFGKTFGVWVDPDATVEEVCKDLVPAEFEQIYRVLDSHGRSISLNEKIGTYSEIEICP